MFLNNESKKLESELKRLGREEQAELKRLKREARKLAVLLKRAERDMLTLEDMIYLDLVAIKNQKNIENIKGCKLSYTYYVFIIISIQTQCKKLIKAF